jgi:hypothetical protein
MFSWLSDPEGTVGEPVPAGTPALDWGENTYDPEIGGRVTVRFPFGQRDSLEVRAGWYGAFEASSLQVGSFGFAPPPGSVSAPVTAILSNEAEVWSGEATWWRDACPTGCARWSTGLGIRYVGFLETARVQTGVIGAGAAFVESDVDNHFLAGQLAARVRWDVGRNLELSVTGKGLLGAIRREVDVSDANLFSGGAHSAASEETEFGWGAELEVGALWRLSNCFGITAGYTALFVGEVVRGHDGMDFSQASTGAVQAQQVTDEVLIHGFFVGIQLSF